jgi:hypothetical protein
VVSTVDIESVEHSPKLVAAQASLDVGGKDIGWQKDAKKLQLRITRLAVPAECPNPPEMYIGYAKADLSTSGTCADEPTEKVTWVRAAESWSAEDSLLEVTAHAGLLDGSCYCVWFKPVVFKTEIVDQKSPWRVIEQLCIDGSPPDIGTVAFAGAGEQDRGLFHQCSATEFRVQIGGVVDAQQGRVHELSVQVISESTNKVVAARILSDFEQDGDTTIVLTSVHTQPECSTFFARITACNVNKLCTTKTTSVPAMIDTMPATPTVGASTAVVFDGVYTGGALEGNIAALTSSCNSLVEIELLVFHEHQQDALAYVAKSTVAAVGGQSTSVVITHFASPLICGLRYRIEANPRTRPRCENSQALYSELFVTDRTAPDKGEAKFIPARFTRSSDALSVQWRGFSDRCTFIVRYHVRLYPTGELTPVASVIVAADSTAAHQEHTFIGVFAHAAVFEVSVEAEDLGGHRAAVRSAAVQVDTLPPDITQLSDGPTYDDAEYFTDAANICAAWQASDGTSGISQTELELVTADDTVVVPYAAVGGSALSSYCVPITVPMVRGKHYFWRLRVTDVAGNAQVVLSNGAIFHDGAPNTEKAFVADGDGTACGGADTDYQTVEELSVTFGGFEDKHAGIKKYELKFFVCDNPAQVVHSKVLFPASDSGSAAITYKASGDLVSALSEGTRYCCSVSATNKAGATSAIETTDGSLYSSFSHLAPGTASFNIISQHADSFAGSLLVYATSANLELECCHEGWGIIEPRWTRLQWNLHELSCDGADGPFTAQHVVTRSSIEGCTRRLVKSWLATSVSAAGCERTPSILGLTSGSYLQLEAVAISDEVCSSELVQRNTFAPLVVMVDLDAADTADATIRIKAEAAVTPSNRTYLSLHPREKLLVSWSGFHSAYSGIEHYLLVCVAVGVELLPQSAWTKVELSVQAALDIEWQPLSSYQVAVVAVSRNNKSSAVVYSKQFTIIDASLGCPGTLSNVTVSAANDNQMHVRASLEGIDPRCPVAACSVQTPSTHQYLLNTSSSVEEQTTWVATSIPREYCTVQVMCHFVAGDRSLDLSVQSLLEHEAVPTDGWLRRARLNQSNASFYPPAFSTDANLRVRVCAGADYPIATAVVFATNRACTPVTHASPHPNTASSFGLSWEQSIIQGSTEGIFMSICFAANTQKNGRSSGVSPCTFVPASDPTFGSVSTESLRLTDGMVLSAWIQACTRPNEHCTTLHLTDSTITVQAPRKVGPLQLQFIPTMPASLHVEWPADSNVDTAYYNLTLSCLLNGVITELQWTSVPGNSTSVATPLAPLVLTRCGAHTTLFAVLISIKKHAGLPSRSTFSGILLSQFPGMPGHTTSA